LTPEQLLAIKMEQKDYFSIDIWALGVSLIEIIIGQDVFDLSA